MKKKADPISMKWYDNEIINNQDRKHLDIQERARADSITSSIVHNVNIVTMTEYPVVITALVGDTIHNEKMSFPQNWAGKRNNHWLSAPNP